MSTSSLPSENPALSEVRRELHELAVLSSALLRLATKVQTRCETLRQTIGGLEPLDEDEFNSQVSLAAAGPPPATAPAAEVQRTNDEREPAALLAMSLAGEGMSREQIGDYLRDSFGIQDADEMLERLLPSAP